MKNNWSAQGFGKHVSPDLIEDKYLQTEVVIFLQGTNMFGNQVFLYLKLFGSALKEMFAKMHNGENFKPSDYGTVIAAGTGTPPESLRNEMKAEYNMVDVPIAQQPVKLHSLQPKFFDDENT